MDLTLEKDIEQKLRKIVEKHGGLCLKWVCPGWSGVPDRIILLPGGVVLFVETKRPRGGKVEKLQKWWAERIRRLGFWCLCAFNEADLYTLEILIIDEISRRSEKD